MKYFSLAVFAFSALTLSAADAPVVVDQIVAKVNGDIVSQDEIAQTSRQLTHELKAQGANGSQLQQALDEREKDILRDRITHMMSSGRKIRSETLAFWNSIAR